MTGNMGMLYPVSLKEVLPGDTMQGSTSGLIRLSPMLAPVMHPITVRFHTWFVPNRITFPDWEPFITGGSSGNDSTILPTIEVADPETGFESLFDYFGVQVVPGMNLNALPIYAYNKIYNEFYRDQDLTPTWPLTSQRVKQICWEKDYFTSARPWTQKGEEVTLPIAGQAPVLGIGNQDTNPAGPLNKTVNQSDGSQKEFERGWDTSQNDAIFIEETEPDFPGIYADLGQAAQVTINEFREAFAMQRYKEARAMYGSRYTEYLRYLGVRSSDARLDRPEYVGGSKATIQISEVLNTAAQKDTGGLELEALGTMGGHGITGVRSRPWRKFFEEHGYLLTLMSVRPKTMYVNSMPRHFIKQDKEDYWQKELEQIGQQEVYNNEVFVDDTDGMNTFGYQDRYSEYKKIPSQVAGEFRNILNHWHMGRDFQSAPALNEEFVLCDATKRIHAEQTQHSLWCMVKNNCVARRLVRKNPGHRII